MPAIGESLREARLRHNVDIGEVSDQTKIRAKYLRALENEEFDQLPGPTYVRTFLRTYAEYLGLDGALLVEAYRAEHGAVAEDEPLTPFAPGAAGRGGTRDRGLAGPAPMLSGPLPLVAAAAVAIVAGLLVIGLVSGDNDGDDPTPPPVGAVETETDTEAKKRAGGRREPKRDRSSGPITLEIAPATPTYTCVDDGAGEVVFEGTISEAERFKGKVLRVNLGNGQAKISVDGEAVDVKGGPNPIGYRFSAKGEREIPDGERPCQL